jgi:hypothetical protein
MLQNDLDLLVPSDRDGLPVLLCFILHCVTACTQPVLKQHESFFYTINVLPALMRTIGELVKNLGNSIHLDSRSNSNRASFSSTFIPPSLN